MRVDQEMRKKELIQVLKDAASICTASGNIAALATVLSVSRQHLYQCANKGEIPPKLANKIEVVTNGKITRERLNPTIFG